MALKELTGHSYEIIDTVHFGQAIGANGEDHKASIAARWLDPSRHRRYNGQSFDGTALRLVPTFSVSYAMTCPLRCTFCYYADADPPLRPQFDFRATTADIWRAWEAGHRNFYFMDPNFLPSAEEFALLRQLYEGTGGDFAYYCQVSPNFLTESRLVRLAETGCRGMVVGIENRARIVAKGSVPEARRRVERVLAHGMMPTLFFMVDGGNDGGNDVEDVVAEFDGIPFRYTVLNNAFAGDRSLASIEAGFAEKRRLSARRRDLIVRLQARPDYLGSLAREGSVSRHTTSAH
jgi:MoaA/NifB/PqqE/SkfB family radical SAM enzyme